MSDLSQHFTTAKLLRYTAPMMAMMLLSSVHGIIDALFVSNLVGKTALASVTVAFPFIIMLSALGTMMGTGGTALVGRLLGQKKDAEANAAFSLIIYVTLGIGVVGVIAGFFVIEPAVRALGSTEDMVELATIYSRIALLAMPLYMAQFALDSFAAASGKPQLGLYATIIAMVVNIVLDALFIAVFKWGIIGAAVATSIAEACAGTMLLVLFARGKAGTLRLGSPSKDFSVIGRSAYNGLSEMVGSIAMSVVAIAYNYQLLRFIGEDGVAAYGAIEYVAMLFGAILGGYCAGADPLMSYQYGAENKEEVRSLFVHGFGILTVGGICMVVLSQLLAPSLAGLFVGYDEALLERTVAAYRIYCLSFAFVGLAMFGSAVFTALGNGFVSAVIAFTHTILFETGSVLLLPHILGPDGIWWSIVVAEICASVLVVVLFWKLGPRYGITLGKA